MKSAKLRPPLRLKQTPMPDVVPASREQPLTRARLWEILSRFEPGVSMEMVSVGWEISVYFNFTGRLVSRLDPADRMVGGRLLRPDGFCSEALELTRTETFGRDGIKHGRERFWIRVKAREAQLARWLADFTSLPSTGPEASRKSGRAPPTTRPAMPP